jgi:quercetin dioxygenase-like cupin family protein
MQKLTFFVSLVSLLAIAAPALADGSGPVKPNLVLSQVVEGLPTSAKSEVRVLTAMFKPGDKTPHHTHDFPVTVYILEGAFTLELKGQPPITVKAGEAYVEAPNVEMTGFNRSTTDVTKVVIFYVSTFGMPFLNPLH